MRIEYEIFIRLVHERAFLDKFLSDRENLIKNEYPTAEFSLFTSFYAQDYGLEEEYYRRISSLMRTSKEIFTHSHPLIMSLWGQEFYEFILANFFYEKVKTLSTNNQQEILEPFDGYVIGPFIINAINIWKREKYSWLGKLLEYEWGIWHAKRIILGWPPLFIINNLIEGSYVIQADFDLKALLNEVKRLNMSYVSNEIYRNRIKPNSGFFAAAIFPKDGQLFEASLDFNAFSEMQNLIGTQVDNVNNFDTTQFGRLSFLINNSFLCCSREMCSSDSIIHNISKAVVPLPH